MIGPLHPLYKISALVIEYRRALTTTLDLRCLIHSPATRGLPLLPPTGGRGDGERRTAREVDLTGL